MSQWSGLFKDIVILFHILIQHILNWKTILKSHDTKFKDIWKWKGFS